MRELLLGLTVSLLCSCAGTPPVGKPSPAVGVPSLQVHFDSATAAAALRWERAAAPGFLRYEVQRADGGQYATLAQVDSRDDTSLVDSGLRADLGYRYRVVAHFGEGDRLLHSVASTVVEGGIHRFLITWEVSQGFLPTRLLVDPRGVVSVVGAGSGRVERFDRAGHSLGSWEFAPSSPACLETGALDAPVVALDSKGNLYVAYNRLKTGQPPRPYWSKFDPDGRLVWARPLEGLFVRHLAIDPGDRVFVEALSLIQEFDTAGTRLAQHRVPALLVSSLRFWGGHFAALVEPLAFVESGWQAPRLVIYGDAARSRAELVIGRDPLSPEDHGNGLLQRPSDFAVDEATSRAFVVNAGQNRVAVFREGAFLTEWGAEGKAEGAFRFAGKATVVADMATGQTEVRQVVSGGIACDPEGYVYVADTFNNRIQKFQP